MKDGGVKKVFFIGSMFARHIPIGKLILGRKGASLRALRIERTLGEVAPH